MTGDASRFFSVRMPIVLTLFAAVLLSGVMVPSIAFGEETGVGHEAGAVDGGTQASTEAHGAADQDEDDSGSGNPHDPDAPSDEGAGSGGVSPSPAYVPGWNTVDGNRYFADEQGKLKSGWLIDGGKRYYLDPGNGNAMARGFVAIEGKSYYLDTDGVLFSSGWLLVDRAWYYAAASGEIEGSVLFGMAAGRSRLVLRSCVGRDRNRLAEAGRDLVLPRSFARWCHVDRLLPCGLDVVPCTSERGARHRQRLGAYGWRLVLCESLGRFAHRLAEAERHLVLARPGNRSHGNGLV